MMLHHLKLYVLNIYVQIAPIDINVYHGMLWKGMVYSLDGYKLLLISMIRIIVLNVNVTNAHLNIYVTG